MIPSGSFKLSMYETGTPSCLWWDSTVRKETKPANWAGDQMQFWKPQYLPPFGAAKAELFLAARAFSLACFAPFPSSCRDVIAYRHSAESGVALGFWFFLPYEQSAFCIDCALYITSCQCICQCLASAMTRRHQVLICCLFLPCLRAWNKKNNNNKHFIFCCISEQCREENLR